MDLYRIHHNLQSKHNNSSFIQFITSHSSNNGSPHTPDTPNYQKNRRVLSDPLNNDSDDEKEFGKKISAPNTHDRQAAVDMILDSIDPEVDGTGARMSPGSPGLNAPQSDLLVY